ncbi:MAG: glycosyltransferase family 39 protein [Acidobacteriota bacterium]|nr:glycosyltransferase family 39 protein [Acidobacteriota bacterium]
MAAKAEAIVTAGLRPELFPQRGAILASRSLVMATLLLLVFAGFSFRVIGLSAEGLSEDELNKLNAVSDYRQNGLTAANGEHPFLMKALQTGSLFVAEKWNGTSYVAARSELQVSPETALRLPGAIFGALIVILIYLVAAELFGAEIALIAATLWAFDPQAIAFSRVAKEDTFLLFFFLLANIFWLRGQRVAEGNTGKRPQPYYWAAAAACGAMLASKYLPSLLVVGLSYYWVFQAIPETRWRLGKKRMLLFLLIMCSVFLLLNPTILLPATWREMGIFAGQRRIGHDGYEFMGSLYSHRMTDWLNGTPWYFYLVFIAVKLPLLTIAGFIVGLPLLFRRKIGDGRYFLLFWLFVWVMSFMWAGGKFTRYFTVALPAVLITSAIGINFAGRWLGEKLKSILAAEGIAAYARAGLVAAAVMFSLVASINAAPHFRLYTNVLGGGMERAGYYFPHDEFYDASMRDAISEIAKRAAPGARIASESPVLAAYYAERIKRKDLNCVSLSDPEALSQLQAGDFIIDARGRRYFSNDALLSELRQAVAPTFTLSLGGIRSADVYQVDDKVLKTLKDSLVR